METFEVIKEKVGFDSKRYTRVFVACFVALPVSVTVLMMYGNPTFNLVGGQVEPQNGTALPIDSKNGSSQLTSMPYDKRHNGSSSRNDSSQLTSIFYDKLPHGSVSRNDSSHPSGKIDDKLLNGSVSKNDDASHLSSRLDDKLLNGSVSRDNSSLSSGISGDKLMNGSVSRNDSSQPTSMANDKLLYGLLASGFDEKSCLSRYESILYRRISPHKPSSYLRSMLRNYEDLHKRCGPRTRSYQRAVKKLKSSHRGSSGGCKYLVWTPANGLGNRMVSMVSAFLYALLTNRVLLLHHGTDMADLFCEPFPNSTWILPSKFPLIHQFSNFKLRQALSVGRMTKNGIVNTSMESPLLNLYVNINHGRYHDDDVFYCDQSQPLLGKVPWLILLSDQYFAPSFFLLPSFKQMVSKMFPEKQTVFHHLGRYLFHPSNQAWGLIIRFYEAYLAKADERIGLQIRVFNHKDTPFQAVMDQILDCCLKEKLLPQLDSQKWVATPSKYRTSKAILITSLYSEFYENISYMYWTKPTVTGEVIGVYQPSHDEYQRFGDNMHNMKAWTEINLLSSSDVLVTSAWSTFGYVAQGLGGLKPWFLYRTNNKHVPDPPCQRDISMEPCFHFPLTYDCKTKAKVDAGSLVPYLRHCKDLKWGVKLVGDQDEL